MTRKIILAERDGIRLVLVTHHPDRITLSIEREEGTGRWRSLYDPDSKSFMMWNGATKPRKLGRLDVLFGNKPEFTVDEAVRHAFAWYETLADHQRVRDIEQAEMIGRVKDQIEGMKK